MWPFAILITSSLNTGFHNHVISVGRPDTDIPPMIPSSHVDERHAAEPAVPADRFAREILAILAVCVMRSRQLNGKPFGSCHTRHYIECCLAQLID